MDKETLSHYGWIIIVIIITAVMIALATPFATSLKDNFIGVVNKLTDEAEEAMSIIDNSQSGGSGSGGGGSEETGNGSGSGGNSGDPSLPAGGEVDPTTGEILDSWEVIINNVNNGTYAMKYSVGDYKPLDLGTEGVVNMQIAALDTDVLSDGSGNAHITWIAKELLATKHNMNSTRENTDGWAASEMRTYLQNDIWALIPATVQNAIVEVDKTYYDHTTSSTLTCSDKVWIPSWREVGLGTDKENSGVIYSELFTHALSRTKKFNGSSTDWWLRSASPGTSNYYFVVVSSFGAGNRHTSYSTNGVALSFCM